MLVQANSPSSGFGCCSACSVAAWHLCSKLLVLRWIMSTRVTVSIGLVKPVVLLISLTSEQLHCANESNC